MEWYDNRLQFRNLVPGQKHLLDFDTIQDLWLPFKNLLFENAIIGKIQNADYFEVSVVASKNSSISFESLNPYRAFEDVWSKGKDHLLQAAKRIKVEYFCSFNLVQFPFDFQKCDLILKMKNTKHTNVYFSRDKSKVLYSGENETHEFNK